MPKLLGGLDRIFGRVADLRSQGRLENLTMEQVVNRLRVGQVEYQRQPMDSPTISA